MSRQTLCLFRCFSIHFQSQKIELLPFFLYRSREGPELSISQIFVAGSWNHKFCFRLISYNLLVFRVFHNVKQTPKMNAQDARVWTIAQLVGRNGMFRLFCCQMLHFPTFRTIPLAGRKVGRQRAPWVDAGAILEKQDKRHCSEGRGKQWVRQRGMRRKGGGL